MNQYRVLLYVLGHASHDPLCLLQLTMMWANAVAGWPYSKVGVDILTRQLQGWNKDVPRTK